MIKKVMFILYLLWVCTILVFVIIDVRCMYKAIISFDTIDCVVWLLAVFSLSVSVVIATLVPILMYNDFKD